MLNVLLRMAYTLFGVEVIDRSVDYIQLGLSKAIFMKWYQKKRNRECYTPEYF